MIDSKLLGQTIAEDIINEVDDNGAVSQGPCFYPGSFKPPHKGHFAVIEALSAMDDILSIRVIISSETREGITPEDSLSIWRMYMEASPNPKVLLQISQGNSPVGDVFSYLNSHPDTKVLYVVGGGDETDDQKYLQDLQTKYPGVVRGLPMKEKAGVVSASYVRNVVRAGEEEKFKKTIPGVAFNKGFAKPIYNLLRQDITAAPVEQEPVKKELPTNEPTEA